MESNNQALQVKGTDALTTAKGLVVNSQEALAYSYEMLSEIVRLRKSIEEFFDPVVKAAHHAHREAVKNKNTILTPVLVAEDIVRAKQEGYLSVAEQRRADLEDVAKTATGDTDEDLLVFVPPATAVEELPTREIWDFEVFDGMAILTAVADGKAPHRYLTVNEREIGKDVRIKKEQFSCPGVRTKKRIIAVNR